MHFNVLMNTRFQSKPFFTRSPWLFWASKCKCKESSKIHGEFTMQIWSLSERNCGWMDSFLFFLNGGSAFLQSLRAAAHKGKLTSVKWLLTYTWINTLSNNALLIHKLILLRHPSASAVSDCALLSIKVQRKTISASIKHGCTHYALERSWVKVLHA